MSFAIGIDVGGTNTRAGIVTAQGAIDLRRRLSSTLIQDRKDFIREIGSLIDELKKAASSQYGNFVGVGLGIPGIFDFKEGVLFASPHFPEWKNWPASTRLGRGWPVLEELSQRIACPLVIDNDANNIAVGEGWLGAGKGFKNFLMMTLGTGIGGGIVLDGKVLRGERGFAGEIGHIVVESQGRPCACGGRGCLETYASATGLFASIEEAPESLAKTEFLKKVSNELTVATMAGAAKEGDPFAIMLFKTMGYYLGVGLASLVNVLGVELVVIGGGIQGASDLFFPDLKAQIKQRTYQETAKRLKIVFATLGDDAGLLGATKDLLLTA